MADCGADRAPIRRSVWAASRSVRYLSCMMSYVQDKKRCLKEHFFVDCQVARLSLSGMLKPIRDASWDLPAATQSVVSDRSQYSAVWHSSPLLRKSLWAPRCETAQTEFLLPTKALCPERELEDPPEAALLTNPHEEPKYVEMLKESEGSVCSWDMRHAINLVLGQSAPSVLLGRCSKTFTVCVTV